MTQLVVLEHLQPLTLFTTEGVDDVLARITKEARSRLLDISTPQGRDEIKSLAYTIARSKTYLDDMGKELVAEQKKQLALVDAERKRIRDTLDALKEEIRAPLTEWENQEKARVEAHEAALAAVESAATFAVPNPPSGEVQQRLEELESLYDRDWQEFVKRAGLVRDAAHKRLTEILATSQKHEAEQAELARLSREKEEREQRERDERIAAEAAEKARREAEEKARQEAEAEAARVRAEQEQQEQERQRIQREKEEAERREAEAEERARKAEEERLAAIAKAEADRKEAEEKAERERKEAEEAAAQRERDRIEAEKKAEADAAAKREADKAHRRTIKGEALAAFVAAGLSEETGKLVIEAIAKGQVPHVKISY